MPVTMEQAAIDPAEALESTAINATVTITPGAEPGKFRHHVLPLSVAGPTGSPCTVTWTLESAPGLKATFNADGVTIKSKPDGVDAPRLTPLPLPDSKPIQFQLTFINNVSDVNVIRYELDLDVQDLEGNILTHDVTFDPTIAVVRDPLDPPVV
jgi:hypothetical protein